MCTEGGSIVKCLHYNRFRKIHTQNEFYDSCILLEDCKVRTNSFLINDINAIILYMLFFEIIDPNMILCYRAVLATKHPFRADFRRDAYCPPTSVQRSMAEPLNNSGGNNRRRLKNRLEKGISSRALL